MKRWLHAPIRDIGFSGAGEGIKGKRIKPITEAGIGNVLLLCRIFDAVHFGAGGIYQDKRSAIGRELETGVIGGATRGRKVYEQMFSRGHEGRCRKGKIIRGRNSRTIWAHEPQMPAIERS